MAWAEVRTDSGVEYVSVALSLDGSTAYAADRNNGVVRSLPFPSLTGSPTVVYTQPTDWTLQSVTDTPDGPLVTLLDTTTFETSDVRDLSDNVIYTTTDATFGIIAWAVWNPVDDRLYVLESPTGSSYYILSSMLADGSDVQIELDNTGSSRGVFGTRQGFMPTSDGAIWFVAAQSAGRQAVRIIGGAEKFGDPFSNRGGLAIVPEDTTHAYQSVNVSSTIELEEGMFGLSDATVATVFDGYALIQSSTTPDFLNGVAIARNIAPSPDDTLWFVFGGAAPWTVGRIGWTG